MERGDAPVYGRYHGGGILGETALQVHLGSAVAGCERARSEPSVSGLYLGWLF